MDATKRELLKNLGQGLAAAGLYAGGACAQTTASGGASDYPRKPIMMVLPAPPGGGTDAMGRTLADMMSKNLGQPVVMDYKGGAGGTLGASAVARAPADGYTLLLTHSAPIYYAPHLFSRLPYNVERDFAFISQIADGGLVAAVHKDVPARTTQELVAWIRQQGKGNVSYGSYGVGSASHLLAAYLNESRGLGMIHVPYKGEAPLIQDLMGQQLPFAIVSTGTALPYLAAGRLRALAILQDRRFLDLPDVPTIAEAGFPDPEFKVIGGLTLLAPAATPAHVLAKLEQSARAATMTTPMKARMQVYGVTPLGTTSKEARRLFDESQPKIARLVEISGAKLD